ncbi:retinoblastoma-like protein 1 [Amphiura filiformis]|uniref:retinoblastoma-like protein 1 n=1 Tax=Amphiura filiformis TaxID=82378 RepID=UPI003B227DB7
MASKELAENRQKRERFNEFCSILNLDASTGEEAWRNYERISVNYTLEGDDLHWLACALYVACRERVLPTVGNGTVEGNCISLTVLLRTAKLSVIQFFNKMKKWSDMANLPQQFRDKVDRLERNFAVSTVIFKKYKPIFLDIFKSVTDEIPKVPRGRKQRRLPCTCSDVFKFCWTLFVSVKGNFPAISDDLVNSYHLLLCCLDLVFANAILANKKDLLNFNFPGLPENFTSRDYRVPHEAPCSIEKLCELHDGLVIEAKGIKQHWWKPHVKKLFERKTIRGTIEKLSGLLDVQNFEVNSKSINYDYEEYVLTRGDFDERIFLGQDADEEIGTPHKLENIALDAGSITDKMQAKRNTLQQELNKPKSLAPSTPLTNRRYLKEKDPSVTPVSTATQTVSRLQALLTGRKMGPSEELLVIFGECKENPVESISKRVKEMGEVFVQKYTQPSGDESGSHVDFAKRRLTLAASLYYKCMESIMKSEKKRKQGKVDLACLLDHDMFHKSLFACCLEVIIFAYNSQRTFPWVIECFDIPAFHYYKVIELLLRAEEGLSRDIVKHLNHVEEDVLQEYAWRHESPLWDVLKEDGHGGPSCEDVSLPHQTDKPGSMMLSRMASSPLPLHPRVRQLVTTAGEPKVSKKDELLQSPTSAGDRFSSPSPGSGAKRRLFSHTPAEANEASSGTPDSGEASKPSESSASAALKAVAEQASASAAVSAAAPPTSTSSTSGKPPQIRLATVSQRSNVPTQRITVAVQSVKDKDGTVRYIASPVKTVKIYTTVVSPNKGSPVKLKLTTDQGASSGASGSGETHAPPPAPKAKKTGSLGLFFRKVYHLINVRLLDLCTRLNIEESLRRKIWTCMEHSIVKHVELMKDRHLDQLIMCAIYVVCKVTKKDQQFQEIMKCYRRQPQAKSHVYRSVLLRSRKRHSSDESSDSSQNSQAGSPDLEKKEANRNPHQIRSASTLPGNLSNSCPPTPTKMAGTCSTFEDEDRGDLIMFYNLVYVKKMQGFALRFSPPSDGSTDLSSAPTLSPMPVVRPHQTSPRKVSSKHKVYISSHSDSTVHSPTKGNMMYYIQKSPAKSLKDINNMIKTGDRNKRALSMDGGMDNPPIKRFKLGETGATSLELRLQQIQAARKVANGDA